MQLRSRREMGKMQNIKEKQIKQAQEISTNEYWEYLFSIAEQEREYSEFLESLMQESVKIRN